MSINCVCAVTSTLYLERHGLVQRVFLSMNKGTRFISLQRVPVGCVLPEVDGVSDFAYLPENKHQLGDSEVAIIQSCDVQEIST